MLPEDRLKEAVKQIELAAESDQLTETEQEWLSDARRNVRATAAALDDLREARDDAEVIDS